MRKDKSYILEIDYIDLELHVNYRSYDHPVIDMKFYDELEFNISVVEWLKKGKTGTIRKHGFRGDEWVEFIKPPKPIEDIEMEKMRYDKVI